MSLKTITKSGFAPSYSIAYKAFDSAYRRHIRPDNDEPGNGGFNGPLDAFQFLGHKGKSYKLTKRDSSKPHSKANTYWTAKVPRVKLNAVREPKDIVTTDPNYKHAQQAWARLDRRHAHKWNTLADLLRHTGPFPGKDYDFAPINDSDPIGEGNTRVVPKTSWKGLTLLQRWKYAKKALEYSNLAQVSLYDWKSLEDFKAYLRGQA